MNTAQNGELKMDLPVPSGVRPKVFCSLPAPSLISISPIAVRASRPPVESGRDTFLSRSSSGCWAPVERPVSMTLLRKETVGAAISDDGVACDSGSRLRCLHQPLYYLYYTYPGQYLRVQDSLGHPSKWLRGKGFYLWAELALSGWNPGCPRSP